MLHKNKKNNYKKALIFFGYKCETSKFQTSLIKPKTSTIEKIDELAPWIKDPPPISFTTFSNKKKDFFDI